MLTVALIVFTVLSVLSFKKVSTLISKNADSISVSTTEKKNDKPKTSTNSKPEIEYDKVDLDYFNDALFIGDSRTVGLGRYSKLSTETDADFFAKVGLTAAGVFSVTNSDMYENTYLLDKLQSGNYGKIYIMFGVNELAGDLEKNATAFIALLDTVRQYQPNAIIFIQSNLHVGENRSESLEQYSNSRLELYNKMISTNADQKNVYYIDINEVYDDEEGNLSAEYTADELHLNNDSYEPWIEYLKNHAIVR